MAERSINAQAKIKPLMKWTWQNKQTPAEVITKTKSLIKVEDLTLLNEPTIDFSTVRRNPLCLVTGDGNVLPEDVKKFENWNIPHDLYCVNRSMLYFQRQVDHWCAIDYEEGMWFSQNLTNQIAPDRPIVRHTIGIFPQAFDVFWQQSIEFDNDIQKRVWIGNSGYFGILTALQMGYDRIVIAGMPMNNYAHWYEPESEYGPHWHGVAFTQWMDFVIKKPGKAKKVRSMGEYSAFILGQATREWAEGAN